MGGTVPEVTLGGRVRVVGGGGGGHAWGEGGGTRVGPNCTLHFFWLSIQATSVAPKWPRNVPPSSLSIWFQARVSR